MKTVTNGNNVKVHYKGTFPDGEVFDDSRNRVEPLELVVGEGRLLTAFEEALVGMREGQIKNVFLTSAQAYGPVNPEATITVPRESFPESFTLVTGEQVRGVSPDGRPVLAKILSFTEEQVSLDVNHPLAGKDLNFEIELVKIDGSEGTESFDNYTVKELRAFAKERGIKGFSTMKKAELVESLSS